jgi:anti-sigma factor RsiW
MNDPTLIGPCADYEHDLLDLHDGALAPGRVGIVRNHLGHCARCQSWLAEFTVIDARLAGELPRPQLSAGFDARLRERLASLQRAPARGELRVRVERERETLLGALQSAARRRAVLGAIGGAMATLCVLAAARGLLASGSVAVPQGVEGVERLIALGAVGAAIAVATLAWSAARYGVGALGLQR